MTTGKTIALTRWTFCQQINVSTFQYAVYVDHRLSSKEQASFNFMAAITICNDFAAPPQNKVCHCFHCLPIYLPWMMELEAMIFFFWTLSFKPAFALFSFTFIKRFFSSSSLSAIRVVSSAYLRLLVFLPAILIPACPSSSLAFHMVYSAYRLNKQGDNIQPWHTSFPIWN